ncbi:MAG TPA: sialate O-acetylesterase, partial [Chitinophagaceae bacterium]|nr:sialate O-acetylesterase [Chitinophagaceae bacterium]
MMKRILIYVLSFTLLNAAKSNIRLPSVLSNNMVLQQKSTVKLWGWGDPAEQYFITTSWNNKTDSGKVDGNAKWIKSIETPSAGGPYAITIRGKNTITLQNILIGEVWVCSGQSNMEMNYNWGLPQMKEDFPTANNPNIRFFSVPKTTAETPQENLEASWIACDSNTVKSFSAVGYYFGKKLNENLNVPIGLINASWGGTPAEAWTPAEVVNNDKGLIAAANKLNESQWWPVKISYAYNAMLAPLTNFSIAGAIWYQGESNTGTASTYRQLFSSMIGSWRKKWNNEFPFYFVQLAPFRYGNKNISALLRESQVQTLSTPKTGMVVTTDIGGDTMDIHPRNKRDVGYRLANIALVDNYGKTITGAKSPLYKNLQIDKDKIILAFNNVENGFSIKGKNAEGFLIAGADKIFYPAEVKLKDNNIIVSSKKVSQPVAVRYAFSNTVIGNVFSKSNLPLSPFRTDDWEVDVSSIDNNSTGRASINGNELHAFGRAATNDRLQLELIGSASHFGFTFEGTECKILTAPANHPSHNYLQYELDGAYQKRVRIDSDANKTITIKASGSGSHTVWVYKATEAVTGPIFIDEIFANNIRALPAPSKPLIEFIGNSITCGAAADPSEVPCGTGEYHDQHNAYYAYGPRVARALNVEYMLSSVSGIGIYRNWNSDGPTMPQVYERTDMQYNSGRDWNFSQYSPKVVSIALGTNDFSGGDGKKQRLPFDSATFVSNYIQFVKLVQSKYPSAQIVLLSSAMVNGDR